jgi:hypothetical protein
VAAKQLFDPAVAAELDQRLAAIEVTSVARWGKFSPQAMLAHLAQSSRMALGELHVPMLPRPTIVRWAIKWLLFHVLPFPRGAPTARQLLTPDDTPLEPLRDEVRALLRRVAALPPDAAGAAHPLFGPMTNREWARLAWLHTDHHLRQFGG